MDRFRFDRSKFEELVLHLCLLSEEDQRFGATKLNKLLYYVDFIGYARFGQPVTGAVYRRLPNGPAPRDLVDVRDQLIDSGDAEVEERPYLSRVQKRLKATRDADLSLFEDYEVELVRELVDEFWHYSARSISEESHREWGWRIAADGDDIPYETALISPGPLDDEQVELGLALAEKLGLKR